VTTLEHLAACELAEKRAIAVYGAVFALEKAGGCTAAHAHGMAEATASLVPRPAPLAVPTALERMACTEPGHPVAETRR
jgi:hypothetical protein